MCSKIHNFYGKSCTHFSRQWITTQIPEHNDLCGRDGETLATNMPVHGAWGSAGVGTGSYTYRGQCVFFNSPNNHCCSTKAGWTEAGGSTTDQYCQNKYGERKDAWDSKHRSWRLLTQAYTPTAAWPVVSGGRRLAESELDGEKTHMHELILPNGTRFWTVEDEELHEVFSPEVEVRGAEDDTKVDKAEEWPFWDQLSSELSTVWSAAQRVRDAASDVWQSMPSWSS